MSELVFNRVILEKNNQTLMVLSITLLALSFILALGLMKAYQKPPLVVYVQDGEISVLKTRGLALDEPLLKDFARYMASQYLSFTANSLSKQIEAIRPYLSPQVAAAILNSFDENQVIIQKDSISQQFVIDNITITRPRNPFWVEVQGTRNIHAAGNDKAVAMTYVMEIKRVRSTESNPYGLLMSDIIEKDKLFKKGKKT